MDIINLPIDKKLSLQMKEIGGAMMPLWPMVRDAHNFVCATPFRALFSQSRPSVPTFSDSVFQIPCSSPYSRGLPQYLNNSAGIIYMVDISDSFQLGASAAHFHHICNLPTVAGKPILLVLNKMDAPVSKLFQFLYVSPPGLGSQVSSLQSPLVEH